MKTLIVGVSLFVAFLIQGCVAYVEPVGGYYYRGGLWYYRDGHGAEYRENHKYHHPAEWRPEEHRDEHK